MLGSGGRNAMAVPVFYDDGRRKYNLLGKQDDHTLLIHDGMRGRRIGPREPSAV